MATKKRKRRKKQTPRGLARELLRTAANPAHATRLLLSRISHKGPLSQEDSKHYEETISIIERTKR